MLDLGSMGARAVLSPDGSHARHASRCLACQFLSLFVVALVVLSLQAADAEALTVDGSRPATAAFSGVGCAQRVTSQVTALLPLGAHNVRLRGLETGDRLESSVDTAIVALVTGIGATRRAGRRVTAAITVQGDPSMCALDTTSPGAVWQTEPLDLDFVYRRAVRVYFPGSCCEGDHAYRPRFLSLGASFALDQARWRRWDGPVATGSARLPFNDCVPYCAAGTTTYYRVSVRLSRPRMCNRVQQYLTLRWHYRGRRPPHVPSRATMHFGYRCE
jgi:hypothetical protein